MHHRYACTKQFGKYPFCTRQEEVYRMNNHRPTRAGGTSASSFPAWKRFAAFAAPLAMMAGITLIATANDSSAAPAPVSTYNASVAVVCSSAVPGGYTQATASVTGSNVGATGDQLYYNVGDTVSVIASLGPQTQKADGTVAFSGTLTTTAARPFVPNSTVHNDGIGPDTSTMYIGGPLIISENCPKPNKPPVASFTVTTSDLTATVTSTSTDPDGTIVSTVVNWGDGTSGVPGSHTYKIPGTYTVTVTVTDDKGASDTATKSVTVTAPAPTCVNASSDYLSHTWNGQSGVITLKGTASLCTALYIKGAAYTYDSGATGNPPFPQTKSGESAVVVISKPGSYPFTTPTVCGQRDGYAKLGSAPVAPNTLTGPGSNNEPQFVSDFSSGPATYSADSSKECGTTPPVKHVVKVFVPALGGQCPVPPSTTAQLDTIGKVYGPGLSDVNVVVTLDGKAASLPLAVPYNATYKLVISVKDSSTEVFPDGTTSVTLTGKGSFNPLSCKSTTPPTHQPTCKQGKLVNGTCVIVIASVPVCSSGHTLVNGSCVVTQVTAFPVAAATSGHGLSFFDNSRQLAGIAFLIGGVLGLFLFATGRRPAHARSTRRS
jgi:PKD repeat protein